MAHILPQRGRDKTRPNFFHSLQVLLPSLSTQPFESQLVQGYWSSLPVLSSPAFSLTRASRHCQDAVFLSTAHPLLWFFVETPPNFYQFSFSHILNSLCWNPLLIYSQPVSVLPFQSSMFEEPRMAPVRARGWGDEQDKRDVQA